MCFFPYCVLQEPGILVLRNNITFIFGLTIINNWYNTLISIIFSITNYNSIRTQRPQRGEINASRKGFCLLELWERIPRILALDSVVFSDLFFLSHNIHLIFWIQKLINIKLRNCHLVGEKRSCRLEQMSTTKFRVAIFWTVVRKITIL